MKEWLLKLFLATIAILSPIQAVLLTVGFLVLADFITGLLAAKKKKEEIKASIMRRSIAKFVVYQLAIISGFLLEKYITGSYLPVTNIVSAMIGIVELKSILENTNKITHKNIFRNLIKILGSYNDPRE